MAKELITGRKVRYGIVGLGKQGTVYSKLFGALKGILGPCELTAVCDIDSKRREYAKEHIKGITVFEDYKEMLSSGKIDAVMIETPHYLHPEIAAAALEAGIHVLCDKPAGVYTKQVREMYETAQRHEELQFSMMFNQRTNPLYIKAKSLIDGGRLGELKRVVWIVTDWYRPAAYYAQGGWRGTWDGEGGGVLINQCPHQLDLLTWLCGMPTAVSAKTATVGRNIAVENDVTAVLTYKNGATGVLITSTHDAPGTNRLEITGDGGKIVIENGVLVFTENAMPEPQFSATNKKFMGSPATRKLKYSGKASYLSFVKRPPQHAGIIRNFTDCLTGRQSELIAEGTEGINGLMLSNAIYLSGWTNKEVPIPVDEDAFLAELDKRRNPG